MDEHRRPTRLHGFAPVDRPDYMSDDQTYDSGDYLYISRGALKSRPQPSPQTMRELGERWHVTLTLNNKEIAELKAMYGYDAGTPSDSLQVCASKYIPIVDLERYDLRDIKA